jgi:GT2 family glycosyltransferase
MNINMDISICIVSWNTKYLLYDCIKSIKEKTNGINYEIIVVDNNFKDGSVEMVRQKFPDCKLFVSNQNWGFVKGNNIAIKKASGKYILYLNPDTTLVTNAINGMYNFLENNITYGAVFIVTNRLGFPYLFTLSKKSALAQEYSTYGFKHQKA